MSLPTLFLVLMVTVSPCVGEMRLLLLRNLLILALKMGQFMKKWGLMIWYRREGMESLHLIDWFSPIPFVLLMNILIWNSRGALKPSFQTYIHKLARRHDLVIFVIIETKLGGSKAKEVSDRLPFDGAIHMETIGFFGGLWLLWNEDKVEIRELAKTEQEIHVEVKVLTSNLSGIFSTIYASPRSEERCIFWNNFAKVTELHNKPWIMAGILTNLLFRRINLVEGALV